MISPEKHIDYCRNWKTNLDLFATSMLLTAFLKMIKGKPLYSLETR